MRRLYLIGVLLLAAGALASVSAQQGSAPAATPGASVSSPTAPENPANDPLFDVPPLPKGEVSLVGGTVAKIDRVRNRVWVKPFGGGSMDIMFDERTHIYRDGIETTQLGIRKGDRVYVDTMLEGPKIFARNIRVQTTVSPADTRGQVVSFDAGNGTLAVRDELTAQRVTIKLTPDTTIRHAEQAGARADLRPGALVSVQFSPDQSNSGVAQQISILAIPGSTFTFSGRVTYLDLHLGTFAVDNRTDGKTYDLHFTAGTGAADKLTVGTEVTVSAVFDGTHYNATTIAVNQAKNEPRD